jgi:hypothetical protein
LFKKVTRFVTHRPIAALVDPASREQKFDKGQLVPILLKPRYVFTRRFRSHHFGFIGVDRPFIAQGARGV